MFLERFYRSSEKYTQQNVKHQASESNRLNKFIKLITSEIKQHVPKVNQTQRNSLILRTRKAISQRSNRQNENQQDLKQQLIQKQSPKRQMFQAKSKHEMVSSFSSPESRKQVNFRRSYYKNNVKTFVLNRSSIMQKMENNHMNFKEGANESFLEAQNFGYCSATLYGERRNRKDSLNRKYSSKEENYQNWMSSEVQKNNLSKLHPNQIIENSNKNPEAEEEDEKLKKLQICILKFPSNEKSGNEIYQQRMSLHALTRTKIRREVMRNERHKVTQRMKQIAQENERRPNTTGLNQNRLRSDDHVIEPW